MVLRQREADNMIVVKSAEGGEVEYGNEKESKLEI